MALVHLTSPDRLVPSEPGDKGTVGRRGAVAGEHDEIVVTVRQPGRQTLTILLNDELVIGRDCEGLLLADSEVSRRHLRLRRRGGAVEVADLGSTNGTLSNDRPLSGAEVIDEPARYRIGDTDVALRFRARSAADGPAEPGRATDLRDDRGLRSTSIDVLADTLTGTDQGDDGPAQVESETLTMVFSDIESSTEQAERMGDRSWFDLLERHNSLIRRHVDTQGGREVKSIGDGFFLTFPSVGRALRFAIDVQEEFRQSPELDLRIRMGIHTGEAIVSGDGDLFGRHVNLAARVANLATGAQVLASFVVREIAAGRTDIRFAGPLTAELKGFDEPYIVHELLWRDNDDPVASGRD